MRIRQPFSLATQRTTALIRTGALALLLALAASPGVAEAPERRILVVAGSTGGANGANFRTEVQLHNGSSAPSTGTLVYHPQGHAASADDPKFNYTLAPFETKRFEDIPAAFGLTGLGSVDLITHTGAAPTVV